MKLIILQVSTKVIRPFMYGYRINHVPFMNKPNYVQFQYSIYPKLFRLHVNNKSDISLK